MVRKRYISEAIAVVNSTDGDFAPVSIPMPVYDAFTGGTLRNQLLDAVGNAITQVTPIAANGYQSVFDGPDGYTGALFLEDPKGIRHIVFPSDLGDRLSAGGTVLTSYLSQIATLPDYPGSFPPALHTHDDRYYTQAQIDAKLAATQPPEILTWNVPGGLAVTADDVVPIYNDGTVDRTIVAVRISVGTAPATTAILVDVNVAGTTIFTTQANRPSIAVGQLSSGKKTNMDVTNWPAGSPLAPNIDQVGSATSPGADMIIQVLAL
jgi:hypothetical protein